MPRNSSLIPRLASIGVLFSMLACDAEEALPGPGTMLATLVSPVEGGEGGAVIELFGDGVLSIEGVGPTEVFSRLNQGGARVALISQEGDQLMFLIELADTLQLPSVVIEEVAGPDDQLRADLGKYKIEFER